MKYEMMRRFGSDVHIFSYHPAENPSQVSKGVVGKLEPLSKINHTWYHSRGYEIVAAVNLGFFNPAEHYGLLFHDGGFMSGTPNHGVEVYLTKKGEFVVTELTHAQAEALKTLVTWGASLSYPLVINGKKNTKSSKPYYHADSDNPRTLIGQKKDGTMLLVVVDGRRYGNIGVTADESADLMIELGAWNAANADGGGSSEMIVRIDGTLEIVNKPSDGKERNIGTALLVFAPKGNGGIKTPKKPAPLIAVDDGHGMETYGKRSPTLPSGWTSETGTFMHENEFNRRVAAILIEELERCGFRTLATAPGDRDVPLDARIALANGAKADFFLSIHANALTGMWGPQQGVETFVYPGGEGERIGKILHTFLTRGTKQEDRGVKDGKHLRVIGKTKMPAALVECGFMDNLTEVKWLLSEAFRQECGVELAQGFCQAYGMQYVPREQPPSKPQSQGDLYRVQVGAFSNPENAERLAAELEAQGYDTLLKKEVKDDG